MKKLLGVSIVAVLAVTPMMANAARSASVADVATIASVTDSSNLATTSYVQGAYKVLSDAHNAVIDDITVSAPESGQTYEAISETNSVGENLEALDAKVKTLNATAATTNSVRNLIDTEAAKASYDSDVNYSADTIGAAVKALQSISGTTIDNGNYIGASHSAGTVTSALGALDTQVKANADAISNNSSAIGASNAASLTTSFSGTNYLTSSSSVVSAATALDTQIKTVNDKQIPIVQSWGTAGNGTVTQKKISELTTAS